MGQASSFEGKLLNLETLTITFDLNSDHASFPILYSNKCCFYRALAHCIGIIMNNTQQNDHHYPPMTRSSLTQRKRKPKPLWKNRWLCSGEFRKNWPHAPWHDHHKGRKRRSRTTSYCPIQTALEWTHWTRSFVNMVPVNQSSSMYA